MLNVEIPQVVITSRIGARISLIIGCLCLIVTIGWLYLVFQPAYDDFDRYFTVMQFILVMLMAIIYFILYLSYSKPNLLFYWDRLIVHSYHSKGEIQVSDVAYVVTGFTLPYEQIPKNQTRCLNNTFTRKNKILIILKKPSRFVLPLRQTKNVGEIVIDVRDTGSFVWNILMRNPEIEVFHMPYNALVYKRGIFTFESMTQI